MTDLAAITAKKEELQAQLAALEKEEAAAIENEKPDIIKQVNELISKYKIAAQELHFPHREGPPTQATASAKPRKQSAPGKPKYRDPKTGHTWSGHGKAPKWIKDAPDRNVFLISE